jgi:uncharacterized protein (TIGR02145 family)
MPQRIVLAIVALLAIPSSAVAQPERALNKYDSFNMMLNAPAPAKAIVSDTKTGNTGNATPSPKFVTIGRQIWMAENLSTDRFRNGDLIPEARSEEEWLSCEAAKRPAWCYYNNDPANKEKFGRLYNWYAVNDPRGLAPFGWHIPTDDEWGTLIYALGGSDKPGPLMRSTTGWKEKGNGNNLSGFNAQPASCRDHYATFYESGAGAYWWTSTPFITGGAGYGYQLKTYGSMGKNIYTNDALSVRCLKD